MTPRMTMSLVIRGPPAVAAASGFIRSFSAYVRFGPPAPDAGAGGWATCARGCRPLLTEMLLQPAIDRVVPQRSEERRVGKEGRSRRRACGEREEAAELR